MKLQEELEDQQDFGNSTDSSLSCLLSSSLYLAPVLAAAVEAEAAEAAVEVVLRMRQVTLRIGSDSLQDSDRKGRERGEERSGEKKVRIFYTSRRLF